MPPLCDGDAAAAALAAQLALAAAAQRQRTRAAVDRVAAEAAAAFTAAQRDATTAASAAAWARRGGLAAADEAEAGFALERDGWRALLRCRDRELCRLKAELEQQRAADAAVEDESGSDPESDDDEDDEDFIADTSGASPAGAVRAAPVPKHWKRLFTPRGELRRVKTLAVGGITVRVSAIALASRAAAEAVRADVAEGGLSRAALGLLPRWPREPFGPAQFMAALNATSRGRVAAFRPGSDAAAQRAQMRYVLERARRAGCAVVFDPTWPVSKWLAAIFEAEEQEAAAAHQEPEASSEDDDDVAAGAPTPAAADDGSDDVTPPGFPPRGFPKRRRSGGAAYTPA